MTRTSSRSNFQRLLPAVLLVSVFASLSLVFWVVVYATTVGPNSPGTMADDATVGTVAWTTVDNAKVSDDATTVVGLTCAAVLYEKSIKIVKGGTIVGTDKANVNTALTTSDTYVSYGGSADLWGTTWTPAEINASNFGVVVSYQNKSTSPAVALGAVPSPPAPKASSPSTTPTARRSPGPAHSLFRRLATSASARRAPVVA